MKKLRFVLSVAALALAAGTVACTSPVAPACDAETQDCIHDVGPNT